MKKKKAAKKKSLLEKIFTSVTGIFGPSSPKGRKRSSPKKKSRSCDKVPGRKAWLKPSKAPKKKSSSQKAKKKSATDSKPAVKRKVTKKVSSSQKKKTSVSSAKRKSVSSGRKKQVRPIKKKVAVPKKAPQKNKEREPKIKAAEIGDITHYFSRISVVVLKINAGSLKVGDKILIKDKSQEFAQKVASLQVESLDVKSVKKGQMVGLKVKNPVKVGSKVYKI